MLAPAPAFCARSHAASSSSFIPSTTAIAAATATAAIAIAIATILCAPRARATATTRPARRAAARAVPQRLVPVEHRGPERHRALRPDAGRGQRRRGRRGRRDLRLGGVAHAGDVARDERVQHDAREWDDRRGALVGVSGACGLAARRRWFGRGR